MNLSSVLKLTLSSTWPALLLVIFHKFNVNILTWIIVKAEADPKLALKVNTEGARNVIEVATTHTLRLVFSQKEFFLTNCKECLLPVQSPLSVHWVIEEMSPTLPSKDPKPCKESPNFTLNWWATTTVKDTALISELSDILLLSLPLCYPAESTLKPLVKNPNKGNILIYNRNVLCCCC